MDDDSDVSELPLPREDSDDDDDDEPFRSAFSTLCRPGSRRRVNDEPSAFHHAVEMEERCPPAGSPSGAAGVADEAAPGAECEAECNSSSGDANGDTKSQLVSHHLRHWRKRYALALEDRTGAWTVLIGGPASATVARSSQPAELDRFLAELESEEPSGMHARPHEHDNDWVSMDEPPHSGGDSGDSPTDDDDDYNGRAGTLIRIEAFHEVFDKFQREAHGSVTYASNKIHQLCGCSYIEHEDVPPAYMGIEDHPPGGDVTDDVYDDYTVVPAGNGEIVPDVLMMVLLFVGSDLHDLLSVASVCHLWRHTSDGLTSWWYQIARYGLPGVPHECVGVVSPQFDESLLTRSQIFDGQRQLIAEWDANKCSRRLHKAAHFIQSVILPIIVSGILLGIHWALAYYGMGQGTTGLDRDGSVGAATFFLLAALCVVELFAIGSWGSHDEEDEARRKLVPFCYVVLLSAFVIIPVALISGRERNLGRLVDMGTQNVLESAALPCHNVEYPAFVTIPTELFREVNWRLVANGDYAVTSDGIAPHRSCISDANATCAVLVEFRSGLSDDPTPPTWHENSTFPTSVCSAFCNTSAGANGCPAAARRPLVVAFRGSNITSITRDAARRSRTFRTVVGLPWYGNEEYEGEMGRWKDSVFWSNARVPLLDPEQINTEAEYRGIADGLAEVQETIIFVMAGCMGCCLLFNIGSYLSSTFDDLGSFVLIGFYMMLMNPLVLLICGIICATGPPPAFMCDASAGHAMIGVACVLIAAVFIAVFNAD